MCILFVNKVVEVPTPGRAELEEYAERFIQPYMATKFKKKLYSVLEGLSYSALSTATKNAFYSAALDGSENGFTTYQLAREAYTLMHHSLDDQEGYIRYLIEAGCALREIHEKTSISMRKIQAISRSFKEGV